MPILVRRCGLVLMLLIAGCAHRPADRLAAQLEAGETVSFRAAARLLHGHDMSVPSYDDPEGYRPIPEYAGELAVTDRRLLFVATAPAAANSHLSIPFAAIARARPSRTPLLHYVVVWDADGHPDSFLVDARHVAELHRQLGLALMPNATKAPAGTRQ